MKNTPRVSPEAGGGRLSTGGGEREPLSGQVTPSDQWSPALRKRWPPDSTGSGSSLADLDTEADGAAGREGCNTAAASSQGAAPGAPGATSLNLL